MKWTCGTARASIAGVVPPPRGGCSWTKVGSRLLLFGGADKHQQHFSDIYSFDITRKAWDKPQIGGTTPTPRSSHSTVRWKDSLLVFGGMNGEENVTFNDLFEFQSGVSYTMTWVKLPCHEGPPRNSHATVVIGSIMIIIGGASPQGLTNDVFKCDLSDQDHLHFHAVHCTAAPPRKDLVGPRELEELPLPREMHSACLCPVQLNEHTEPSSSHEVLVMGGRTSAGVERSLFSLNIDSWQWTRLTDAPAPRCAHSACFLENSAIMAIYGGWDGGTTIAGSLCLYDALAGIWTTVSIDPVPTGRFGHASCAIGKGEIYVFGGVNPCDDLTEVIILRAP
ncbi:unnamed protein product [Discosporangium mesarthrocarpum]